MDRPARPARRAHRRARRTRHRRPPKWAALVLGSLVALVSLPGGGWAAPARPAAPAQDQRADRRGVRPGGVATVPVEIRTAPGDSVAWELVPTPDVRVFGPRAGTGASPTGRVLLPFTFTIPAAAPAGPFEAGRVRVRHPDGREASLPVIAEVLPRRALVFRLAHDVVTVEPGGVAEVAFLARNEGNVTDTLRTLVTLPTGWSARDPLPDVVLAPGDSLVGILRLAAPARALPAGQATAVVAVGPAGDRKAHTVRLVTVTAEGPVHGLAHLPATAFIGSSTDDATAPAMALSAEGDVAPGTRMTVAYRSYDRLNAPAAFRESLLGPRMLLGLESRRWSLRLGDLYATPDILTGSVLSTRGTRAGWHDGGRRLELSVARPTSFGLEAQDGRVLRARGAIDTRAGEVSVQVADIDHAPPFGTPYALRAGGAGYRLDRHRHRLSVDAGLLSVTDGGVTRAGAVVDGRYQYTAPGTRLGFRVRRVPATVQRTASYGDEAFLSASHDLAPAFSLTAWAFDRATPRVDGPESSSRGGGGGFRLGLPAGSRLQLLGTWREDGREDRPDASTRALRAGLTVPAGPVILELDADAGTIVDGHDRPFRSARGGVRWSHASSWAWAGASYHDTGFGRPFATLDAAGSVLRGDARISGGLTARLTGAPLDRAVTLWSGATVPVTGATELSTGLDYRPIGVGDPLRLSLGVRHRLRLPVPLPSRAALDGVVFEDLDGDRVRDPGEPPVAGVGVLYGPFRAATDDHGRFGFRDPAATGLALDPGTLPRGLILPTDVYLPDHGSIEIPLIRLASIEIQLFLDRDGDGARDPAEAAGGGALVLLAGPHGREQRATAGPGGSVRFGGLEAGRYTLTIRPAGDERHAGATSRQLQVEPGTDQTLTIALPAHRREIRIQGGRPLRLLPDDDGAATDATPGTGATDDAAAAGDLP